MKAVLLVALAAVRCLAGWRRRAGRRRNRGSGSASRSISTQAKDACYVRLLLSTSTAPATRRPSCRASTAGARGRRRSTARCHLLMHVVGRQWAPQHHLTLERLQKVVPRSNDPGCSAGFGMGLVMALGPQIISTGGKSALKTCDALPTRLRQFTCVHSLGHALMRGYHETLFLAVNACTKLGARYAPDCAQGAFHDYWISLRGADDTTSPLHAVRSPRRLCAQYPRYALACWYRYWIEQAPGPVILNVARPARLCRGLAGGQRAGCIAGASKDVYDTPAAQARLCANLDAAADALACLRGVANQAYAGKPRQEVALFRDVRAHAGRCAGRVRCLVREDVQRARERTLSRARVPRRRTGVPRCVRDRCPAVGRAARDLLLGRGLARRVSGGPRAIHPPRLPQNDEGEQPAQADESPEPDHSRGLTAKGRRRLRPREGAVVGSQLVPPGPIWVGSSAEDSGPRRSAACQPVTGLGDRRTARGMRPPGRSRRWCGWRASPIPCCQEYRQPRPTRPTPDGGGFESASNFCNARGASRFRRLRNRRGRKVGIRMVKNTGPAARVQPGTALQPRPLPSLTGSGPSL